MFGPGGASPCCRHAAMWACAPSADFHSKVRRSCVRLHAYFAELPVPPGHSDRHAFEQSCSGPAHTHRRVVRLSQPKIDTSGRQFSDVNGFNCRGDIDDLEKGSPLRWAHRERLRTVRGLIDVRRASRSLCCRSNRAGRNLNDGWCICGPGRSRRRTGHRHPPTSACGYADRFRCGGDRTSAFNSALGVPHWAPRGSPARSGSCGLGRWCALL